MGAYLSEPVTSKETESGGNDVLEYGATTMQGWRINQEDAHNAILNYGANQALFAVYDGHGGPEVAEYTAKKFPEFLQTYLQQKEGEIGKAIQEAFIAFDETLTKEPVLQELATLAEGAKEKEGLMSEDEEDKRALIEEACLPLEQVLLRYGYSMTEPLNDDDSNGKIYLTHSSDSNRRPRTRKRSKPGLEAATQNITMKDDVDVSGDLEKMISEDSTAATAVVDDADHSVTSTNDKVLPPSCTDDIKMAVTDVAAISNISPPDPDVNICTGVVSSNCGEKCDSDISDHATETTTKEEVTVNSADSSTTTAGSPPKNGFHNNISDQCESNGNGAETKMSDDVAYPQESHDYHVIPQDPSSSPRPKRFREDPAADVPIATNGELQDNDQMIMGSPVDRKDAKQKSLVILENADDLGNSDDEDDDADFVIDGSGRVRPVEDEDESGDEDTSSESDEDEEEDDSDEELQFSAPSGDTPGVNSGTTACVVLVYNDKIYVGNAGDSRCVLCRAEKAVDLSVDHKPEDDAERERIEKAGGRVTGDGRVNNGLNLSRAIGDHYYKQNESLPLYEQMISAMPDVVVQEITKEDEFLVVACDGIWNSLTSTEVVDFVRTKLKDPSSTLESISQDLCERCLATDTHGDGTGCDNMTVLIVKLKREGDLSRIKEAIPQPATALAAPTEAQKSEIIDSNKPPNLNSPILHSATPSTANDTLSSNLLESTNTGTLLEETPQSGHSPVAKITKLQSADSLLLDSGALHQNGGEKMPPIVAVTATNGVVFPPAPDSWSTCSAASGGSPVSKQQPRDEVITGAAPPVDHLNDVREGAVNVVGILACQEGV